MAVEVGVPMFGYRLPFGAVYVVVRYAHRGRGVESTTTPNAETGRDQLDVGQAREERRAAV